MLLDSFVYVTVWALVFLMLIELIRALPWPSSFLQKKPLSCDVCMSGWSGIILSVTNPDRTILNTAAAGLCLLVLIVLVTPRRGPPAWE